MDKEDASTRFRKLATGDKRPDTARLRDIFDDVEVALKAKVSQATVLAELESLGFTMKLAGFKSALQRIRKERKETKIETAPAVQEVRATSPVILDAVKPPDGKEGNNENLNETNPLRKLSGSRKPGEFNPIPTAKVEFD